MITIIHGDDIVSSRNFLLEAIKKENFTKFDGGIVVLTNIVQIVEGGGLFNQEKKIVIEELFTKRKGQELTSIISYLDKNSKDVNVLLWEGRLIGDKIFNVFKKPILKKVFKIPQTIFYFLDSIQTGQGRNLIVLFHKALEKKDPELVFQLLIRQFRLIISMNDHTYKNQIDEVKRLAPWQKTKLQKQANNFSKEKLKKVYNMLYQIDILQKTGSSPLSLRRAIDFLLVSI